MKLLRNKYSLLIILVFVSAFIFLAGLGTMPLTDPDEVFYAETAREMLNRGDFLTPHIFGKPQFEKPPLYYWLVMFSFKALGVNEFSARFPSAILGILGVIAVYFLGKLLINKRVGFLAGIVLATNVMYMALARACVTDMALTVFMLSTFLFFFYGNYAKSGKTKWYLLSSLSLGLAVLTKGPVGIFLPVVIIGLYLTFAKGLKRLKEIPFASGILLFLVISVPWYFLMYRVHGKEFIDMFFGFHNIVRFLEPEHSIGDVFYYYIPVMAAGLFPWTLFLPLGIWQVFREKSEGFKKAGIFSITWFLVIFVFFSLSRTKLPTYIFPIYPALALLIAYFWNSLLEKNITEGMERLTKIFLALLPVLLIGGIVAVYFVAARKYPTAAGPSLVIGAIFVIFITATVVAFFKEKYKASLTIFVVSLGIIVFPLSFSVFPEIGKYAASKEITKHLMDFAKPGETLGAETRYRRGVAFYANREDVLDVHSHNVITKLLIKPKRAWCVLKEKNHIQLYTDEEKPYHHPTYVIYKLGNKIIITNKVPLDGKFLKRRSIDEPY